MTETTMTTTALTNPAAREAVTREARARGFYGHASVSLAWEEDCLQAWDWESHDRSFTRGGRLYAHLEGDAVVVDDLDDLPETLRRLVAEHDAAVKAAVARFCEAANSGASLREALKAM